MVVTQAQLARRALVKVLLSLASVYAVLLSVTRESNDADVLAGYKKLMRKVHPDKGGRKEDCQLSNRPRTLGTLRNKGPSNLVARGLMTELVATTPRRRMEEWM